MRWVLVLVLSGCSGAAAPFVTVPITVHCSWAATDGGENSEEESEEQQVRRTHGGGIIDSDCIVRGISPSTSPSTQGQSTTTGPVAPVLDLDVDPGQDQE